MNAEPAPVTEPNPNPKAAMRAMWAQGNYHEFARQLVWPIGKVVTEAAALQPGERLLDVAAGTGNVAIRAAEAGARVVALDLTPENFPAGRAHAAQRGVNLEWVEGDAEALPFANAAFDVVTSCFGALFAPNHERVASEMLRVCRPGGRIVMANFQPLGTSKAFFDLIAQHAPAPPPGARTPTLWGDPDYVRTLLGPRVATLSMTSQSYLERAASPQAYCDFFKATFGPMVALYSHLAPPQRAAFDADFLAFATRHSQDSTRACYEYQYLLIVAQRA